METYIKRAEYVLAHISPDVTVHRLTGDCPKGSLVAPEWNTKKNEIIAGICRELESRGLRQGMLWKK